MLGERAPKIDGFGLGVALAQQFGFQQVEIVKFLARAQG